MSQQLSANDLKTRGVAAIEALLATQPEAMISVRGKERFVVMDVAHYHYLRECELEAALAQSQADVAAGRFADESASAHMARLEAMLAADSRAVNVVDKPPPVKRPVATKTKAKAKPSAAKVGRSARAA
jgi:hypothetical protein